MDSDNIYEVIYCAEKDEYKTHNSPISISPTQREKHILTKHTLKNPNFFDTDKISNDYINNHNKQYYFLSNVSSNYFSTIIFHFIMKHIFIILPS